MYSVEDPGAANGSLSGLGDFFEGAKFPGVGAQIMGADDKYLYQFDESVKSFWGSKFLHFHRLFIHPFSCAGFLGKNVLFLTRVLHCISRQTHKTKSRPWPNRVILLLKHDFWSRVGSFAYETCHIREVFDAYLEVSGVEV